ncbi:hypothetical protein PACF725_2280 [Pseudomonas aeruginosa]|nr:hypothetical protein PACF725_2280 [Pseudomonas aeruginosa]
MVEFDAIRSELVIDSSLKELYALEEVGVRDAQRGNLLVLLADLRAQRADQCIIGGFRWALSPLDKLRGRASH